jgi:hypothetical protein
MPAVISQPTTQELVQQKYPTAFAEDDMERVRIRIKETVTEICPNCHQQWTHEVTNLAVTLGSGGDESLAWKSAAQKLGLI